VVSDGYPAEYAVGDRPQKVEYQEIRGTVVILGVIRILFAPNLLVTPRHQEGNREPLVRRPSVSVEDPWRGKFIQNIG
jgi:hypothetical protein